MKSTMKSQFNIPVGTIIKGKWHGKSYQIVRELGRGAIGVVFLADAGDKQVALKISENQVTITSEVNVLKAFSKVPGATLGPSLLDVDDWTYGGKIISFYVMEYIRGVDFITFIRQKGPTWVNVLIVQLLKDLQALHELGWVFGDLKPENLIVTNNPTKIRCIDVGGTTPVSRAIKEYTEFFDRGYWGLGSRKAEPSYDLFAVAMIVLNAHYPKQFPKQEGGISQLKKMITQKPEIKPLEPVLLKALMGNYLTANEMRKELLDVINEPYTRSRTQRIKSTKQTKMTNRKKRKSNNFFETAVIVFIICFIYFIYIYDQIL